VSQQATAHTSYPAPPDDEAVSCGIQDLISNRISTFGKVHNVGNDSATDLEALADIVAGRPRLFVPKWDMHLILARHYWRIL
jgi:hypothetical protein